jgi:tRNA G10  N-methylase Trm11
MGADCAVNIIKFLAAHNVTHITDPFCGKGSVLAAANAFGISAQGVDVSAKQGEYAAVVAIRFKPHNFFCSQRL